MSDKLKVLDVTNSRHLEHAEHQDDTIARRGSVPKRTNDGPVPHSWGATSLQKNAANIGGMGHPTAAIDGGQTIAGSSAAAPLRHAYGSAPDLKSNSPAAPPYPGQRSQTNRDNETYSDKVQHGRDMLAVAIKGGGRS